MYDGRLRIKKGTIDIFCTVPRVRALLKSSVDGEWWPSVTAGKRDQVFKPVLTHKRDYSPVRRVNDSDHRWLVEFILKTVIFFIYFKQNFYSNSRPCGRNGYVLRSVTSSIPIGNQQNVFCRNVPDSSRPLIIKTAHAIWCNYINFDYYFRRPNKRDRGNPCNTSILDLKE